MYVNNLVFKFNFYFDFLEIIKESEFEEILVVIDFLEWGVKL